jgi:hypothetical protein
MTDSVPTKPIKVLITTDLEVIQGYLHVKVGGYQSRISDLLNAKDIKFLPITDAVFLNVNNPKKEPDQVETIIVRIDSIRSVVPDSSSEEKAVKEAEIEAEAEKEHEEPDSNLQPKGWG